MGFFFMINFLIYLFIHFWPCWVFLAAWAFIYSGEWGLVSRFLNAVASRREARALGRIDFNGCGTQTGLPSSTWGLPGPGIKWTRDVFPHQGKSPALAGGFFTTKLQGNPLFHSWYWSSPSPSHFLSLSFCLNYMNKELWEQSFSNLEQLTLWAKLFFIVGSCPMNRGY